MPKAARAGGLLVSGRSGARIFAVTDEHVAEPGVDLPPGRPCDFCREQESTAWVGFGQGRRASHLGLTFPRFLATCPQCVELLLANDADRLTALLARAGLWPSDEHDDLGAIVLDAIETMTGMTVADPDEGTDDIGTND